MYNGLWNEVINRETCLLQMKNLLSAFMFHEVKQSWSVEVPVSETSCRKSSLRHAKKKNHGRSSVNDCHP